MASYVFDPSLSDEDEYDIVTEFQIKGMFPEIADTTFARPDSGGITNLGFTFHGVEFTFGPGWAERSGIRFARAEFCLGREMEDDAADHGEYVMLDGLEGDVLVNTVREFINRY